MLAKHTSSEKLYAAARAVGVGMYYAPYWSSSEQGLRFRLKPVGDGKRCPWQRFPYWRTSASFGGRGRTVCAVCWHGHREFFRALFALEPKAKVLTAQTRRAGFRYYTADNFEDRYEETDVNIGPQIAPLHFSEACHCDVSMTTMVPQNKLTAECWLIQFSGTKACDDCEVRDTDDCGGPLIRKTGMNELGYIVPIRPGSQNLFGPRKETKS